MPTPPPAPPAASTPWLLGAERDTTTAGGTLSGFARLGLFRADGSGTQAVHNFSLSGGPWASGHVVTASRGSTPGVYTDYRVRALWLVDAGAVYYLDLDRLAQGPRRVSSLRLDTPQAALCRLRVAGSLEITDPLSSRAVVQQAGPDGRCDTADDVVHVLKAAQTETSAPLRVPALAAPEAISLLENPDDRASKKDWFAWLANGAAVLLNDDLDTATPLATIGNLTPARFTGLRIDQAPYPSGQATIALHAIGFATDSQLISLDLRSRSAQRFTPPGQQPSIAGDITPDAGAAYVMSNRTLHRWSATPGAAPVPLAGLAADLDTWSLTPVDGGVIAIGISRGTQRPLALLISDSGATVTRLLEVSATDPFNTDIGFVVANGNRFAFVRVRGGQPVITLIDRSGNLIRETPNGGRGQIVPASDRDYRTVGSTGHLIIAGQRAQGTSATEVRALNMSTGVELSLGSFSAGSVPTDWVFGEPLAGRHQALQFERRTTDAMGATRIAQDSVYVDLQTPNSLRRLTNNINF